MSFPFYTTGHSHRSLHILDGGRLEPALLVSGAQPHADGTITYPPHKRKHDRDR